MRGKKGFTLVEVMTVCLILVIVIIGSLGVFIISLSLNEGSKNTIIALSDASSVLEDMRNLNPFTVPNLLVRYPDATAVAGYSNLPQETVRVDYANTSADPLHVTVTVSWQHKQRIRTEKMVSLFTAR